MAWHSTLALARTRCARSTKSSITRLTGSSNLLLADLDGSSNRLRWAASPLSARCSVTTNAFNRFWMHSAEPSQKAASLLQFPLNPSARRYPSRDQFQSGAPGQNEPNHTVNLWHLHSR